MKHTPGPWQWEINKQSKNIHLAGGKPRYDQYVLGFDRFGMQNGQPTFNIGGRMTKSVELTEPYLERKHHEDWFSNIKHPDAKLIAAAPDLLEALLDMVSDHKNLSEATIENARKAIAKAVTW